MKDALISKIRQDVLRAELPRIADLLHHRRAGEIAEADIEDLVSLSWLEWLGGSLKLTIIGNNLCHRRVG